MKIKGVMIVKIGIILIILILCLFEVSAKESPIEIQYARDPPVHQYLVYQGYLLLDGEIKAEMGKYIGGPKECIENSCGSENKGKTIAEGAYEEDKFGNWMNHFWDPDTGSGLRLGSLNYSSAYDMAEELWNESLEFYAQGDEEMAYYTLGRVAHLLADVSVPAHVHLDFHPPWDKDNYEEYISTYYEEYKYHEILDPFNLYVLFY